MSGYTRHQLKEDRFKATAGEAVHWSAEHRNPLLIGLAAVFIVALLVIGSTAWYEHRNDLASQAFGKAMATVGAPVVANKSQVPPGMEAYSTYPERAQAARKALEAVAAEYPHTTAGRSAAYLAATTAMTMGDNKYAEEKLKELSNSGDAESKSLAKFALASVYRNTGRTKEAETIYNDLKDHPTTSVPKSRTLLEMADMYETTQPSQAVTIYQQVEKDFAKTKAAEIAADRLSSTKKI